MNASQQKHIPELHVPCMLRQDSVGEFSVYVVY